MAQGNGSPAPSGPPSPLRMLLGAWARVLSPTYQSTDLSQELERFGEGTVKSVAHLRRVLTVTVDAMALLAVLLVAVAVVATGAELLRLSGLLPSHGSQLTVPRLIPPGFLVTIASGSGLWLRSRRKRLRSTPRTVVSESEYPPADTGAQAHCRGCRCHDNDHPNGDQQATAPPPTRGGNGGVRRPPGTRP
jgi:hypothetical protein